MKDILIVDDSRSNVELFKRILKIDYEIRFALDGQTALELINAKAPDLILLDIMMPKMNGYEVCARLKACERTRDIPVIFVTSTCDYGTEARCFSLGAVDYIAKPLDTFVLRARIKNQLIMREHRIALKKTLKLHEEVMQVIACELRTPLNTIAGYSEMSLYHYDTTKQFEYLQKIYHQADQILGFIDDVLSLTQQEQSGLQIKLSLANIAEIAIVVTNAYQGIASALGVNLKLELPKRKLEITLDITIFKRVLKNLIINAIKFSPSNAKVTVRLEPISQSDCGHKVRIQVIDAGIGIPEKYAKQVFEKDAIVKLKQQGLSRASFELAFCKMAIEALGGRIFVLGNGLEGTIFTIEI